LLATGVSSAAAGFIIRNPGANLLYANFFIQL
jgi:hypothetical protein